MVLAAVKRYFKLEERNSNLVQELRAGAVTFITVAYTIAVAPSILSESGGPCTIDDCTVDTKASLITACTMLCGIACIIMGIIGNVPLGMVIGMGLAPYFTYNVVGFHGSGNVSYGTAVTAVLFTGLFFVILSVSGVRGKLIKSMPKSLLFAITAGIGLFLTHLGLQQADGLGIITYQSATLVTLGGCPRADRAPQYTIADPATVCVIPEGGNVSEPIEPNLGPPSSNYTCLSGMMQSATMWLGISGLLIIAFCTLLDIKGATMIGVLWVTFISWIPGTEVSYFGEDSQVPGGEVRWEYFKKVVTLPTFGRTWVAYEWHLGSGTFWLATFTMLYVGFFDTTGCLYAMGNFIDQYLPGFIDPKTKEFPRMDIAFTTDGVCAMLGSIGGLSPICVSGESGAGIREGGRTGIAAIFIGILFLISMFLAPLFASIPPYATGPALIVVGSLMMSTAAEIDWGSPMKAIPAFITIALMPLTYSIAYGVLGGLFMYLALRIMRKVLNLVARYVFRYKGRLGYKLKALSPEEEDDGLDDLGGGESIVNMSYTGDFVSQTMLRQSIQQRAPSMTGSVELAAHEKHHMMREQEEDDDLEIK